jgi:hypothetical protein
MASTTFVDNSSIIYASWLNDINATTYNGTFISSTITPSNLVCNGSVSGTGFTGLVNNTLSAPGQIGNGTPNTGAFTTLSTSGLASLNSLSLTTALSIANGGTGLTAAGSAGSVLTSNGTSWSIAPKITSGTAVASTSGTSIDFTGIPSWVKRITVMFNNVSTSGTSNWLIQLGDSGGIETTGYTGAGTFLGLTAIGTSNSTNGFLIKTDTASYLLSGIATITLLDSATNTWASSGNLGASVTIAFCFGGSKATSATLDRIRITTANGTDTFDAGSINILYE